jgi:ABC-type phosphate transport system auxiliary subunit
MLLCVSRCTLPLPWVWCSCCPVSLSVHTTPPLGLVFMLLCESVYTLPLPCESVCAQYGTPPMGLVLMLLCESVCTNYPSPGFGVHGALRVSLYTLPLPWVWCSCCSASLSVHTTPPLGLVFMLPCESVCTHYPSPGFGVHGAL